MRVFESKENQFHITMTPSEAANFVRQVAGCLQGALEFTHGSSVSFAATGVRAEDDFEYPTSLSVFVRSGP